VKGLYIPAGLKIAKYLASSGWISRYKRRHNIVYRNLSDESRSVDSGTAEDWKSY
jgi:hypothetical protein